MKKVLKNIPPANPITSLGNFMENRQLILTGVGALWYIDIHNNPSPLPPSKKHV